MVVGLSRVVCPMDKSLEPSPRVVSPTVGDEVLMEEECPHCGVSLAPVQVPVQHEKTDLPL